MFRGSSTLLLRSARHHEPVIEVIAAAPPSAWELDAHCYTSQTWPVIRRLDQHIRNAFGHPSGVSDTWRRRCCSVSSAMCQPSALWILRPTRRARATTHAESAGAHCPVNDHVIDHFALIGALGRFADADARSSAQAGDSLAVRRTGAVHCAMGVQVGFHGGSSRFRGPSGLVLAPE